MDEETARTDADTMLSGAIATNVTNIAGNATAIMAEQTARTEADMMLGGRIDTAATARMAMDDELMGHVTTNAGNIVSNEMAIGANAGNISANARFHRGQHELDRFKRIGHQRQPQHDRRVER